MGEKTPSQPHNVHMYVTFPATFPAGPRTSWGNIAVKGKGEQYRLCLNIILFCYSKSKQSKSLVSITAHLSEERWHIRTPVPSLVFIWFHLSHNVLLNLCRQPAHETCALSMFWLSPDQAWAAVGIVLIRGILAFSLRSKFYIFMLMWSL